MVNLKKKKKKKKNYKSHISVKCLYNVLLLNSVVLSRF